MDLRTGIPLWRLQNGVPCRFPILAHDEETDVAVLGAGITGALATYLLARAGVDVVLVDRRDVGCGSTVASTALLQHAPDASLTDLARQLGREQALHVYREGLRAIGLLESLTRELGDACGFARRRSLYLASSDADAHELREEYELRARGGLPVEHWDAGRVRRECSFEAPRAIWSDGDAQIDAYRLTHRLVERAVSLGARAYAQTEISRIETKAVFVLSAAGGATIRARRFVLATGYESQQYLARPVARLMSTFALAGRPLGRVPGWPDECLMWETARPYFYLRRTDDGRALIGGEDAPGPVTHAVPGLLRQKQAALESRWRRMFPHISFEPDCVWGGTFVESEDGLPYIGESPNLPGMWFALGYGGNGITFAMLAAEMLERAWCEKEKLGASVFGFARRSG